MSDVRNICTWPSCGHTARGQCAPSQPVSHADIASVLAAQDAQIAALEADKQRLRYVLDGVRGAIRTGRNEPLEIWREQIDIALAALDGQGDAHD